MSYDSGSYGRQGGYGGQQQDLLEYGGGGGRGSDNYYNQQSSFNDETSSGYGQGGSDYQSGSKYYHQSGHDDYQGALGHVQQYSSSHNGGGGNNPEEESNIFANALGFLAGNKHSFVNENIDELQAINAHQAIYGAGGESQSQHHQQHGSETLGAGAALQALKLFTGGGGAGGAGAAEGHGGGQHGVGGNNRQNKFIGLAMAQASRLFDQQSKHGKVDPSASKQDAVNSAAKLALKMYMKSSQGGGGGGGGGGPAGLLGKFL